MPLSILFYARRFLLRESYLPAVIAKLTVATESAFLRAMRLKFFSIDENQDEPVRGRAKPRQCEGHGELDHREAALNQKHGYAGVRAWSRKHILVIGCGCWRATLLQ